MDEKDLIQSFNDYIEPPPIPFQFGAPGWYVLGAFILLVLLCTVFFSVRYYRRNLYRKQAILHLTYLQQSADTNSLSSQFVYETAILLKRVAMAKYGRAQVAGLSGDHWIQWLNAQITKPDVAPFDHSDKALISDNIYNEKELSQAMVSSFVEKVKNWIRYHHAI